jgi:citrate synthase
MPRLREKIRSRIPKIRAKIKDEILSKHADKVVCNVTVKQVYGGMRGVIGLVCNSSYVDPAYQGYSSCGAYRQDT